jgi:hypothetical protein
MSRDRLKAARDEHPPKNLRQIPDLREMKI